MSQGQEGADTVVQHSSTAQQCMGPVPKDTERSEAFGATALALAQHSPVHQRCL